MSRPFAHEGKVPVKRDASWSFSVKVKQPQFILSNRKLGRCFNVLLCHCDRKQYLWRHNWMEVVESSVQNQKIGNLSPPPFLHQLQLSLFNQADYSIINTHIQVGDAT